MATVNVRPKYRKDGTLIGYYARWYDPARRPQRVERSLRTRDQGEAHRNALQDEHELRLGLYDPWTGNRATGSGIALSKAVDEYLDHCDRRGQSPHSIRIKRSRLGKLLKRMPPAARVQDVGPRDVEEVLHRLKGRPDAEGNRGPASDHTRQNHYGTYCGFFHWAREQNHLPPSGPTGKDTVMEKVKAPPQAEAERTVMMPDEVERVKAALIADGETNGHRRNRAFLAGVIDFACATGLRVAELSALCWEHVELRTEGGRLTGTIAVENYRGGKRRSSTFKTKTRARRRVTLFPRAAEVLARLEPYRTGKPGEPVFRGAWGGRLDKQVPTRLFTEYVEMAKLTKSPTFHDCRHTFISWCANELAVPLPVVQRLAGHARIETTMKYCHVSERTVLEAVDRALSIGGDSLASERARANTAAVAIASWMAGAEAYDCFLEDLKERGGPSGTGGRGGYTGNAPSQRVRAGRSDQFAEPLKTA